MSKETNVQTTMGRPKIKINWDEFDKLCLLQCTLAEIASWFNCSEDTIERRCKEKHEMTFADVYKIKSKPGKISLRRLQFKAAENGNTAMLIWLGKQWLGQKDTSKYELGGQGGGPLEIKVKLENE
jgi:hypothetical protein